MGEWGSGLIGAIIGAVISGVLSFLVLRFNYRQLYAEIVSKVVTSGWDKCEIIYQNCWLKLESRQSKMLMKKKANGEFH